MVTEFILTDVKNDEPIIAPSIFIYIAQSLGPNSGLLPSLLRLRINQADNYSFCLHLLHTPSLRTLEATVPDRQHPNFFSFLTTLVHKAPLLEEIILGPGQFPLKSLQEIPKFTHLRQLELRDVALTIDFTFLQDVGTLLNLEYFLLDARSCTYNALIPEDKTPPSEQTEFGSQMPQPSSDIDDSAINEDTIEVETVELSSGIEFDEPSLIVYPSLSRPSSPTIGINEDIQPHPPIDNQMPCNKETSISAAGGFYQLRKFHFVGGLSLLQDMILYIASSTLEDISITFTDLPLQDLSQEVEAEDISQAKRRREFDEDTQLEINAMEKETRSAFKQGLIRKKNLLSKRNAILQIAEIRWKEQEVQFKAQYEERKREEPQYTKIFHTMSTRWSADLKTLKFNNLDRSPQPLPTLPVLPKQVYGPLFCYPNLEILKFKQWRLDSVEDLLLSMKSSSNNKKLKQLNLPIDDPESAISLYGLLDIAEACPMLQSLHCSINTSSPIPKYSSPTTEALSHGLQSLFVANNPTSLWDFDQLLLVARHLYLTFPRVQTIDSVEGPNAEQWVRIRELVRMFQVIRQDNIDAYR